jgi:hypothetical protein
MAYVNKYRVSWSSKNIRGYIYIDEDNYAGGVTDLKTEPGAMEIRYGFGGWEDPIIGLNASFSVINDQASIFTLLPLLTAEERKYLVRIVKTYPSTETLFEGFLNCESVEQAYLKNRPIRLAASSYISKLENITPTIVETLAERTFIDIIDQCLRLTGRTDSIRVNAWLYPGNMGLLTNQTLFNVAGIFTEMFWTDNVKRDSALEIIRKILKAFNCFIFWYKNSWYIERYEDIWNSPFTTNQNYIIYASGVSYLPTSTNATSTFTSIDPININSLILTGQSHKIKINPGYKEINLKLDQKDYFNLTRNDFSGAVSVNTGTSPTAPLRNWKYWIETGKVIFTQLGKVYKDISNSIRRDGWANSPSPVHYWRGLYTNISITLTATTSLTIKYKYATNKGNFGTFTKWADYKFKFYYFVRSNSYFCVFNTSTNTWSRVLDQDGATSANFVEINGDAFNDATGSVDVEFAVPIGEISGFTLGKLDLTVVIATEMISKSGMTTQPATTAWFGDVIITASGDPDPNDIKAETSSAFLNKLSLDADLYDSSNYNIKNGILWGDTLEKRTTTWSTDNILFEAVIRRLIRQKMQLYRISRQVITASIRSWTFYRPLQMFTDSNQAGKKYLLTDYSFKPDRDEATVEFSEYDNTETINFI